MLARSGAVWLFDSGAGHLAIAKRGGFLSKLVEGPTEHFRDIESALDALDRGKIPAGIIFAGGPAVKTAGTLLADSRLTGTPVLFAYPERVYDLEDLDNSLREQMYFAPESLDLHEAVSWFAETGLGRDPRSSA